MNEKDSAAFEAHLRRRSAERPHGIGFVNSDEGTVTSLNNDGTFNFRVKRTGATISAPDKSFHSYYASNH